MHAAVWPATADGPGRRVGSLGPEGCALCLEALEARWLLSSAASPAPELLEPLLAVPPWLATAEAQKLGDTVPLLAAADGSLEAALAGASGAGESGPPVLDPRQVGHCFTAGYAYGLAVAGSFAYVAAGDAGLQIINISDPLSPTYAGGYGAGGSAYGVAVAGTYAYLAAGYAGLQIIDISNPSSPTYAGGYDTSGSAYGVAVAGSSAYVADDAAGLQIIDISNPSSPTYAGGYDTAGLARGVAVVGPYAYVADSGNGLEIIDISSPSSPTRLGGRGSSSAEGVTVEGSFAYVADGYAGLKVIYISYPWSPTLAGSYNTNGYASGVAVAGSYAYVADGDAGLQIIDIANPFSPAYAGRYDTAGYAAGVAVAGSCAYVADGYSGLAIVRPFREAPTNVLLSASSVPENLPTWTPFATLITVDADPDETFSYTLVDGEGGGDNSSFQIQGDHLCTATTWDYETKSSYSIRIRSTDSFGLHTEKAFTISVTDVNEAPTAILLSNATIAENEPAGTTVGVLSTLDPDGRDTFTYSLVSGEGDAGNSWCQIVDNELRTAAVLDYEAMIANHIANYYIRIRSTDSGDLSTEQVFYFYVTNVNEKPTDIWLDSTRVLENRGAGTGVGNLGTSDPDVDETFTYSLVSGEGDADNALFQIVGYAHYQLCTAVVLDYETKSTYSIRLRSTDSGGLSVEKVLAISVIDGPENPSNIWLSNASVWENRPAGTTVGLLVTADPEPVDTFTYSLVSGEGDADNASFQVVGTQLRTTAALDYEAQKAYSVRVRSTDKHGLWVEKRLTIAVLDEFEPLNPRLVGQYDTTGHAFGVAVAGSYAYVADGEAGLQIIDISNPFAPRRVGGYDTAGSARSVVVVGSYAYVSDDTAGLQIIDVSNPSSPWRVGGYDTSGGARSVDVMWPCAFVADYGAGLQIIDMSNRASPTRVGGCQTSGAAFDVAVVGYYAYVAVNDAGLQIINVHDLSSPTLLGACDTDGYAHGIAVVGPYAYVADYHAGLQIIAISNPSSPTRMGRYDTAGYAEDVVVAGPYACVADGTDGLQIIRIDNPSLPTRVAGYDTIGYAYDVAVVGSYAYVADYGSGLAIVRDKNRGPVAAAGPDQAAVEGQFVSFSGIGSSDPDGDPLTYTWSFGDGSQPANGRDVTYVYADDGNYVATLTVMDGPGGLQAVDTVAITVTNVAPTLTPAAAQSVLARSPLTITDLGQFVDPGFDGPASGTVERFTYSIDWGDGSPPETGAAAIDAMGGPQSLTRGSFDGQHTYAEMGQYNLVIAVVDDDGGADQRVIPVSVRHWAAADLVDLSISADDIEIVTVGDETQVTVTVCNYGGVGSPPGGMDIFGLDTNGRWSLDIPPIPPGGFVNVTKLIPSKEDIMFAAQVSAGIRTQEATSANNRAKAVGKIKSQSLGPGLWTPKAARAGEPDGNVFGRYIRGMTDQDGNDVYETFTCTASVGKARPQGEWFTYMEAKVGDTVYVLYPKQIRRENPAPGTPTTKISEPFNVNTTDLQPGETAFTVTAKTLDGQVFTWPGWIYAAEYPLWLQPRDADGDPATRDNYYDWWSNQYQIYGCAANLSDMAYEMNPTIAGVTVPVVGGWLFDFDGEILTRLTVPLASTSVSTQTSLNLTGKVVGQTMASPTGFEQEPLVDPWTLELKDFHASLDLNEVYLFGFGFDYPLFEADFYGIVGAQAGITGSVDFYFSADLELEDRSVRGMVGGSPPHQVVALKSATLRPRVEIGGGVYGMGWVGPLYARLHGKLFLSLEPSFTWKANDWEFGFGGGGSLNLKASVGVGVGRFSYERVVLDKWIPGEPPDDDWQFCTDDAHMITGAGAAAGAVEGDGSVGAAGEYSGLSAGEESQVEGLEAALAADPIVVPPMLAEVQLANGATMLVRVVDVDPDPQGVDCDLYYTIRPPGSATGWTPLALLATSTQLVMAPAVVWDDSGQAVAAWVGSALTPEQFATASDAERLAHQDIYAACFNGQMWSMPCRITEDSYADWGPTVAIDESSGSAWVAWSRSTRADLTDPAGYEIVYSAGSPGMPASWSSPWYLTSDDIPDYDPRLALKLGESNCNLMIGWQSGTPDGDPTTQEIRYALLTQTPNADPGVAGAGIPAETASSTDREPMSQDMQPAGPAQAAASGLTQEPGRMDTPIPGMWWYGPYVAPHWQHVGGFDLKATEVGFVVVGSETLPGRCELRAATFAYNFPWLTGELTWQEWADAQVVAEGAAFISPQIDINPSGRTSIIWQGGAGDSLLDVRVASAPSIYQTPSWSSTRTVANSVGAWSPVVWHDASGDLVIAFQREQASQGPAGMIEQPFESDPPLGPDVELSSATVGPDMAVHTVTVLADVLTAGSPATLKAEVANEGFQPAAATTVDFYLGDPDAGGAWVGSAAIGGTQPGQAVLASTGPVALPIGASRYYARAVAVPGERSTANNTASVEVAPAPPDVTGPTAQVSLHTGDLSGGSSFSLVFSEPVRSLTEPDVVLMHETLGPVTASAIWLSEDGLRGTVSFTGRLRAGMYTLVVWDSIKDLSDNALDGDGDGVPGEAMRTSFSLSPAVFDRRIFYNGSCWDGGQGGANAADDAAIARDKRALTIQGVKASYANCTNYSRGINGIMVDVDGLADVAGLNASTVGNYFTLKVGDSNDPEGWKVAPAPSEVLARPRAGADGSVRVTLIWPDNAIQNQWLQVTAKAGPSTGLVEDDVFCFGNLIGDVDGSGSVDVLDYVALKRGYGTSGGSPCEDGDFDADGDVDRADLLAMKANFGRSLGPPPAGAAEGTPAGADELVVAPLGASGLVVAPSGAVPDNRPYGPTTNLPADKQASDVAPTGASGLVVAPLGAALGNGPHGPATNVPGGAGVNIQYPISNIQCPRREAAEELEKNIEYRITNVECRSAEADNVPARAALAAEVARAWVYRRRERPDPEPRREVEPVDEDVLAPQVPRPGVASLDILRLSRRKLLLADGRVLADPGRGPF